MRRPAAPRRPIPAGGFTPLHRGGEGPPLVCLHGFTDTWRAWELVLPALERRHDVLCPTLLGHAGNPAPPGRIGVGSLADAVERAMDAAGFGTAHVAGNSLGGYVALQLAERGRARSVVALAPAGGWAPGDRSFEPTLEHFEVMRRQLEAAAPHAEAILSTDGGRRQATRYVSVRYRHIPAELLAHQMRGVVACTGMEELLELARRCGWPLRPERIECPIRIVWGDSDQLLPWPRSAAGYRTRLPHADWVELPGVGHAPQLDVPLQAAELILGHTAR
jgi:pimeloyl-ACP methyl ester carboxylesterase